MFWKLQSLCDYTPSWREPKTSRVEAESGSACDKSKKIANNVAWHVTCHFQCLGKNWQSAKDHSDGYCSMWRNKNFDINHHLFRTAFWQKSLPFEVWMSWLMLWKGWVNRKYKFVFRLCIAPPHFSWEKFLPRSFVAFFLDFINFKMTWQKILKSLPVARAASFAFHSSLTSFAVSSGVNFRFRTWGFSAFSRYFGKSAGAGSWISSF